MDTGPEATGGQLIYIDRVLWSQLGDATSAPEYCKAWLALQCSMIDGVEFATVVLKDANAAGYEPVAFWPNRDALQSSVVNIAEQALSQAEPLVLHDNAALTVAYPINVDGELAGVVSIGLVAGADANLVLRQLQWGAVWIDTYLRKTDLAGEQQIAEQLITVLDLIATALGHKNFNDAARAVVTEMAVLLECDRVSLGFLKSGFANVVALSHSSNIGGHMNLVRAIGNAMDEAIDQHSVIVLPVPEDGDYCVTREHEHLSGLVGGSAVLTVPLVASTGSCGAMTFERPADSGFDTASIELCKAVGIAIGPMLDTKRKEDRSIFAKIASAAKESLGKIIGPGHIARKLLAMALLLFIGLASVLTGEYRVSANSRVEGAERRVVTAPVDGYISVASVRAGDVVQEGDVLFKFDERDARLERVQVSSERAQLEARLQDAMAKRERAEVQIIGAQIEQSDAHLALLDEQIKRMIATAPFDGIVVSGDLSQSLGAAIERGATLFELAPLNRYRVILEVDEHDIADVTQGQTGSLMLAALPGELLPIRVTRMTSVASTAEGVNYFRVEADLLESPEGVRPGMEGVGKIDVEERRLIWIWSHKLLSWIQLQLWAWSP